MSPKPLLLQAMILLVVSCAGAQTSGCEVPDGMTKAQKLPCIRAARILLDQPVLTLFRSRMAPTSMPRSRKRRDSLTSQMRTISLVTFDRTTLSSKFPAIA